MKSDSKPFVGPRPFESKHQGVFFGRERATREVFSLIIAHGEILLYAQSGAGKTSLINAGLVPMLKKKQFGILPIARVRGSIPDGMQAEEIRNLYSFFTIMKWAPDDANPRELSRLSLSDFLKGQKHHTIDGEQPLRRIIIFDQFEELFTSYPERKKDREDFFEQVAEIVEEDPLVRVVFVMREDYLADLDPYVGFLPDRLRTRYRLERLRREPASLAVEGPLQGTDRKFAQGVASSLVQELLKTRGEDADGEIVEITGEYVEPVQLQIVCDNLWDSLPPEVSIITSDHLQGFGDVDQALELFYEKVVEKTLKETGVSEMVLRNWFNTKLITLGKTRGMVFRGKTETEGIPNAVVDVLQDEHIIRPEVRAGARWYELTHDRFIDPVLKSNQRWYEESAPPLIKSAKIWDEAGRREQYLVPGEELKEAEEWAEKNKEPLDDLVRTFIEQSRNREDRRQKEEADQLEKVESAERLVRYAKRTKRIGIYCIVFAALFLIAASHSWYKAHKAKEVENVLSITRADSLVKHAVEQREDRYRYELAALMAVQAYRFFESKQKYVRESYTKDVRGLIRLQLLKAIKDGNYGQRLRGHIDPVKAVKFIGEGARLIAARSTKGTVLIWDLKTPGKPPEKKDRNDTQTASLSSGVIEKEPVDVHEDGSVWRLDLKNPDAAPKRLLGPDGKNVLSAALCPHGKTLATGCADGSVWLWDLGDQNDEHTVKQTFRGHRGPVVSVAFSPDGKMVASGGEDREIRLWPIPNRGGGGRNQEDSQSQELKFLVNEVSQTARRNLTLSEWHQFVGEHVPYEPAWPESEHAYILIDAGKNLARTDNVVDAVKYFERASERRPESVRALGQDLDNAAYNLQKAWEKFEEGKEKIKQGEEIVNARESFDKAQGKDPDLAFIINEYKVRRASLFTDEASRFALDGLIDRAIRSFEKAKKLDPKHERNNELLDTLCLWGSLWNHAEKVKDYCNADIVEQRPSFRYGRGFFRALTKDYDGAIDDFKDFLNKQGGQQNEDTKKTYEGYIEVLKRDRNPFDRKELNVLRKVVGSRQEQRSMDNWPAR